MPVELAGITLEHLTEVVVRERARLKRHAVPGLAGDLAQTLGRASVDVVFRGIFYGPSAAEDLDRLRGAYLEQQPVDFFTEAVGEGYFSQVLIAALQVNQRAGTLDQFDFVCEVVEYVEPPEPLAADPFGELNSALQSEAMAFMDDVQNALAEVSDLVDLIANVPDFGDPTGKLPPISGDYLGLARDGTSTLSTLRGLF